MEHAYAQALWRSVQSGMNPKTAVARLMEVLKVHGREALTSRIARSFERIAERELAHTRLVVSVVREKEARRALKRAKRALGTLKAKPKEVETRIDETLIGGWRLEGQEHLIDASFKRYLLDMYTRVTSGL